MSDELRREILRMVNAQGGDEDLIRGEKRQLAQPAKPARPDTIFRWHLNEFTVFEEETDPKLMRQGVRLRRVGVTEGGRLSDALIATEEARLGVALPAPWREVYTHFNGGSAHELYWGDWKAPRMNDIALTVTNCGDYLALQDVGPLRDVLPRQGAAFDCSVLDPRLIAIACKTGGAVVLVYRDGDAPRVWYAFFSRFEEDPARTWEESAYSRLWPSMEVFFAGLYLQDRILRR